MKTHYAKVLQAAVLAAVIGCATGKGDRFAEMGRDELCSIAYASNDVCSRIKAIEMLNQLGEPGFGYCQVLQDNRIGIPLRVEIIKRHGDSFTQDQLKELAGVNNMYDVRKVALSYITDREYLLWVASNTSIDTLADFALQRAKQLNKGDN